MALKTYVGARYAPKFMGAWNKSNEYAALSVVYNDNQSYVSRKTVPAETEITDTEYWIRSSDWNAQVDQYRNQVDGYNENVVQYNQNVEAYNTSVNNFFEETIHAYNTKEDMVKDQSIKEGYILITCGETAIGDGSGAFYQAVTETSSGAVALENGLFAKKFQLMPERFNRYSVDDITKLTNMNLAIGDEVDFIGTFRNQPVTGYDLLGNPIYFAFTIKSAIYVGTTDNVTDPNDNTYVKINNDNKVFKIGTVDPYLRHNENVTLTLLPEKYGTNSSIIGSRPSLGVNSDFIIGKTSTYWVKMQGDSATSRQITVKTPTTNSETITFTPLACDYYLSINYHSQGSYVSVYPAGGLCVIPIKPTNNATSSGIYSLRLNSVNSFYEPVIIGGSINTLSITYQSMQFNCDLTNTQTLLTSYIPFSNGSGSALTASFRSSGVSVNDETKTLTMTNQVVIPSGRSFWMFMLKASSSILTVDFIQLG